MEVCLRKPGGVLVNYRDRSADEALVSFFFFFVNLTQALVI